MLTWRVQFGELPTTPIQKPVVFVDAHNGRVLLKYDNLKTSKNREVHNMNHLTVLPGPIARIEGQAAVGEPDVDGNFARLGSTYDCYKTLFGRDSYDNAGAKLISSVNYGVDYFNAYWNGTQMVYGDGDNVYAKSFALPLDVTAHELTHGVTEKSSDLTYIGESGGLNEAMSDVFAAVCELYRDNGGNLATGPNANTWMMGEEFWLDSQALRFMNDPAKDGFSLDYYSDDIWHHDVHYTSGIPNLAFYLLSQGGSHPRGKSTNVVSGIGIADAARIFYRLNTVYLTPSSTFGDARVGSVKAADDLFGVGSAQSLAVKSAWTAVGVEDPIPPVAYSLIDTKLSGFMAKGTERTYSFASQDRAAMLFEFDFGTYYNGDVFVKFGSAPTDTDYDCNWYYCEFNPAQSGTYYVRVKAAWGNINNAKLLTSAALEMCADGTDNDSDGKADCGDPDCALFPACLPPSEVSCFDGVDSDRDGQLDCKDSDCAGNVACAPEALCGDGLDNDKDTQFDCDDADCATDAVCANTGWINISSSGFEGGLGAFALGGIDAARVQNATVAAQGVYSIRIRDNSGAPSSISTKTAMNLSAYSRMKVDYKYYTASVEAGESFLVEVLNGTQWDYVDRIVPTTNGQHLSGTSFVNLNLLSNKSAVKVRFRADASDDSDAVYLDNIVVSAK